MIKFFQKIRRQHLAENTPDRRAGKTGKYLIYALGEIVLVVIGILIALQINNWNEDRKAIISERSRINSIHQDLNRDLNKIEAIIEQLTNQYTTGLEVLKILENKESVILDSARLTTNIAWVLSGIIPADRDENTWDGLKVQGIKTFLINDTLTLQLNTFYTRFDGQIERFNQLPKKIRQELRELTGNCHNSESVKAIFEKGIDYYGESSYQLRYCIISLEKTPELVGSIAISAIVNIKLYEKLKKKGEAINSYLEDQFKFLSDKP